MNIASPPPSGYYILKASGERALYSKEKLQRSLLNAGANQTLVLSIVEQIGEELYEGITTKKIYQRAFELLKRGSKPCAARYKLKKAIMELGPSGYPFERFIGEIMKYQGYAIEVGVNIKGHCISHEVDVLAEREGVRVAVECKFGNTQDKKVNVKVPLYIRSRFEDLQKQWNKSDSQRQDYEAWIVTNSSFTSDAIRYGNCAGLRMIAWNYPKRGSLKEMIEISNLYPLTTLISLKKSEKQRLLDKGIVLCSHLFANEAYLEELKLETPRINAIRKELTGLCEP